MSDAPDSADPAGALGRPVYAGEGYKPFGEFTPDDARGRAAELQAVTGWGPTARVGGVARAWSELGRTMAGAGVARVRDLDPEVVETFARKLWVLPPGGSLL
jgi:hypothetical protein